MNFRLLALNNLILFNLVFCCLFSACKKEMQEREVDAFANLDNRVDYVDGQYVLRFHLTKFNYSEVIVNMADNLSSFHAGASTSIPYKVFINDQYDCSVYLGPLSGEKSYYYQIAVRTDNRQIVVSDVYSFKTQK